MSPPRELAIALFEETARERDRLAADRRELAREISKSLMLIGQLRSRIADLERERDTVAAGLIERLGVDEARRILGEK